MPRLKHCTLVPFRCHLPNIESTSKLGLWAKSRSAQKTDSWRCASWKRTSSETAPSRLVSSKLLERGAHVGPDQRRRPGPPGHRRSDRRLAVVRQAPAAPERRRPHRPVRRRAVNLGDRHPALGRDGPVPDRRIDAHAVLGCDCLRQPFPVGPCIRDVHSR
jgi:hypothetical protein